MKKLLFVFLTLIILVPFVSFSQGSNDEDAPKPMYFGPYIGWSVAGINATNVPTGTKNSVETASFPNFGIMGYVPTTFMENTGVAAFLGMKQVAYGFDMGIAKDKRKFNYFIIGGIFSLSEFTVGFDASIPMSGTSTVGSTDYDLNTDNMQTSVDLKIGGLFKLYENKSGMTNLFLNAGYFLIEQYKSSTSFNPKPAHIEVGLSYLFNTNSW